MTRWPDPAVLPLFHPPPHDGDDDDDEVAGRARATVGSAARGQRLHPRHRRRRRQGGRIRRSHPSSALPRATATATATMTRWTGIRRRGAAPLRHSNPAALPLFRRPLRDSDDDGDEVAGRDRAARRLSAAWSWWRLPSPALPRATEMTMTTSGRDLAARRLSASPRGVTAMTSNDDNKLWRRRQLR